MDFLRESERRYLWGVLLLLVSHLGFLWAFDLGMRPGAATLLFTLAAAGWVYAARGFSQLENPRLASLLTIALVLRSLLLPLPPTLSDDVYRYVWDGRVWADGKNPYALAPDAAELQHLRDDLWEQLPHRHVAAVYPPLSMAVFSIASRLANPVLALKLLWLVCDLVACALLWLLAERLARPPGLVAWYAWSPLVVLEGVGMGHVDAFGVPFVIGAWWLLVGRRGSRWLSALPAAAAILIKLVPIVCVPIWARAARRASLYVLLTGALCAAVALPLMARDGFPAGVARYGVSWEFNGPLYEPLWRLLDAVDSTATVEAALDRRKEVSGAHDFWNRFYPYNYPRFHAKLLLLVVLAVAAGLSLRRVDPVDASGRLLGAVVLVSATVYPWYLLWVLPWAALYQRRSWLLLSGLIFLSYLPQTTGLELMPTVFAAIWVPFFAVWCWELRR